MFNIPSVRLAVPKATAGEISRKELIATVLGSQNKLVYIQGGAGYGKTTLLSQIANSMENTVWLTLDGESNVFTFLDMLIQAVKQPFPYYNFTFSEYLPFEEKNNFTTILANSFISSIEKLSKDFMIIIDDVHTADDSQIKKLLTCLIKYKPENIKLCLSSREVPWQELGPLRIRGNVLELTQKELAFTRDETANIMGFDDENIYNLTEGWPLAIGSFKLLLDNGVSHVDLPKQGKENIYSYLFYECISRLPSEMMNFLKVSAFFDELDPKMLDAVLNKNNSKLMLETLTTGNIFTVKTDSEQYRYHSLFKEYLLAEIDVSEKFLLLHKALFYYFEQKDYPKAAQYALILNNKEMLEKIILISYRTYIKSGNFNELRVWFQALGDATPILRREILVAKGAYLSSIGNFTAAKICLDAVIPLLKEDDQDLYIEAMVHKARVLRNFISFEESNKLLDELITKLYNLDSEISYTVVIEKIYNLCWNSQIEEAYSVAYQMIETCAKAGNVKVKAWYERYLSVIHFLAGRMKEAIYYYEKSLELPESDRKYLDMHSIDIYVAKAYQMMGKRDKAVTIITTELQKLRSTGRYEELWLGYLFAAEIHYQNTFIDRINGGSKSFETTMKYFTLANEYAPLYRKTDSQMQWTKMQRLIYSLISTNDSKEEIIDEILTSLDQVGDYFKTIALGRLFGYCSAVSDFPSAVKYAKLSIEIGERSNMMLIPTMAYGLLARAAIALKDQKKAIGLTKHFLQLCSENGIYEYFRMRKAYDPILEFAYINGIEPDITRQMMLFADYKPKRIYIQTLGGFSVFSYEDRQLPLKMRTKRERELLAFILDSGHEGVTKEQIYNALWAESESEDVKKLIGVNLAHLKKDLESYGVMNPIANHEKHYSICRDEIECDIDIFEETAEEFKLRNNSEAAQKILNLYKGEYLSDFEALWAVSKRIRYHEFYEKALNFSKNIFI